MIAQYITGFLILFGYIGLNYLILRIIRKKIVATDTYTRINILSLTYTLLFGIGVIASGGDPGFAFLCPLILALIFTFWEWFPDGILSVYGILIPFLFWWTIIFMTMLVKLKIKQKSAEKSKFKQAL